MQVQDEHIDPESDDARILHVINEMLAPFGKQITPPSGLFGISPPLDTSKPNQHDSKAEFQREYDIVLSSLQGLEQAVDALFPDTENDVAMEDFARLASILNDKLRKRLPREDLKNSNNLLRKNMSEVGGITAYLLAFLDLKLVLNDRLQELEDQKELFWNLPHRAPDYYARAIALRLAKLFAGTTGKRPTFGTSGETGDPSTAYSRALRGIFKILGIASSERSYAEWAVNQISDEDLVPPKRPDYGALLGYKPAPVPGN